MKTLIDTQKEKAQMLIMNANGGSFTVNTKGMRISGRGVIQRYDNGFYEVTPAKLSKLKIQLPWMTDF